MPYGTKGILLRSTGFRGANPLKTILLIGIAVLASGCATGVSVNVNAITNAAVAPVGKNYVLINYDNNVSSNDLYFQEFRRYFDYILQKQGYNKAQDSANADIKIMFQYGMSDGRTGIQTFSWPIYETFGGQSYTITEKSTDSSGQTVTTRRTVHVPAYVRQVGSSYETRSYTLYNRYVNLTAFPIDADIESGAGITPIWNINIHSVGENSDLRAIMPYLAAAAYPYVGKNSGQQQILDLSANDPVVNELKQLTVTQQ